MKTAMRLLLEHLLGLSRSTKTLIAIGGDLLCIAASWLLMMKSWQPATATGKAAPDHVAAPFGDQLDGSGALAYALVYALLAIVLSWRFGLYRTVLRFAGVQVLRAVAISYATAAVGLAVIQAILQAPASLPQYVGLLAVSMLLCAGGRAFLRELIFQIEKTAKAPVVIYGAGESGRQLLTAIAQSKTLSAVAMIDASAALIGTEVHGVRVYPPSQLGALCASKRVKTVILAIPSLTRSKRSQILQSLSALPVSVSTMPRITDVLSGSKQILDLQEVSVDDLLGRDPVAPLRSVMQRSVQGRVICVTGGGGSIGSEIVRQLIPLAPKKIVIVELSEFALYESLSSVEKAALEAGVQIVPLLQSVTDRMAMTEILQSHGVDLLFHAAAYKHVPLVESNPFNGMLNNVFGTQATLDAAKDAGVSQVVLISTDKAVRPTNIMGASKRIAELIAQAYSQARSEGSNPRPLISMVRFGNVLASSGSVVPRFQEQIRQGGPVTVTHPEITRYFMTVPEAVELVIQSSGMARPGDVFLLDMGEPVRILDLATRLIWLSGFKPVLPAPADSQDRLSRGNSPSVKPASAGGEIPVVFTGLRPGEKLYEELLIDASAQPTEHPMIRRASERSMSADQLMPLLEHLRSACDHRDLKDLINVLAAFNIGYSQASQTMEVPTCSTADARARAESLPPSPHENTKDVVAAKHQPVRPINPLLSKALHLFFLFTRPLTMGVRAVVVSPAREILLVRHRYEAGWQLPGGGVEIGESTIDALKREVLEEAGVEILDTPVLLGSYHNSDVSERDHVLLYRCERFELRRGQALSSEIAECTFFPLDDLPSDLTPGTRRRLSECFDGLQAQPAW